MFEHVAIIGATGAVGRELIDLLGRRGLAAGKISLLASRRSAGTTIVVVRAA